MYNYLALADKILTTGEYRLTRAKVEGKKIGSLTLFGERLKIDISERFPLLTTKYINFENIIDELLWFISGSTNIKGLNSKIWNEWADENGELGKIYGYQWRKWNGHFDQLTQLINDIKTVKSEESVSQARRLILTAWNPSDKCNLPPCHCFVQFDVYNSKISCQMYQRSADYFLGVPYNIASYALLTYLLARYCELIPDKLIINFGNVHIYENHVDQVRKQIARRPYDLPEVEIKEIKDFFSISKEDVRLINYVSHSFLKGTVAI